MSDLVNLLIEAKRSSALAKDLQGRALGATMGVIVDVDDPLYEGRVKVAYDSKGQRYTTQWIPTTCSFRGRLPKALLLHRCVMQPIDGDMHKCTVTEILADDRAPELPKNSLMTRLPIYESNEVPPPALENRGCVILVTEYAQDCDWLLIGMVIRGKPMWVPISPAAHAHHVTDHRQTQFVGDKKVIHDRITATPDMAYVPETGVLPSVPEWLGGVQ